MICGPSGSNMMSMKSDTKLDGISLARQLLRSTGIDVLMMEGVSCCTWANISNNTVVRPDWQVNCDKMRFTNMNGKLDWNKISHFLSSLDWNVRSTQFFMFDFNGNCCPTDCSDCRILFWRGEANHVWSGDITTKITRVSWTVWDRICELLSKANPRGTGSWTPRGNWQTWLLLEGKVTRSHVSENDPTTDSRSDDSDAMNMSREGDDRCSNQVLQRWLRSLCWILSFFDSWVGIASVGTELDAHMITWQLTRGARQCHHLESQLILWVKSVVYNWLEVCHETRSDDSADQGVIRPYNSDPRTAIDFSESSTRSWRVWVSRRRTQSDQFSFCVKNLVVSGHCGISPRRDDCDKWDTSIP